MPPALVAELEDVAEELARLCGCLGIDDLLDGDEEVEGSHSDREEGEEVHASYGDGCESLASSLAAASSECQELMKLIDNSKQGRCVESIVADDEEVEDSTYEGQQEADVDCASEREHDSDSDNDNADSDSECKGGLVNEFDGFASELEALSSRLAGLQEGSNRTTQDKFQDSRGGESDPESESDDIGDSVCNSDHEPQEEGQEGRSGATAQHQAEDAKVKPSSQTPGVGAPRQARSAKLQESTPPHPTTLHIRRRAVATALRARARKRALARAKTPRPTLGACASRADESYWHDFQRKSFARHISRQQLARVRAIEEQAAEKRLVAARFQHSATLRRDRSNELQAKGGKQEPVSLSASRPDDRSYLERFVHRLEPHGGAYLGSQDAVDADAMTRVLCGVYTYGHRVDGVVYMTFASMTQLRERIASRLGVSPIANLYRERGMAVTTASASVQPLSRTGRRRTGKATARPTQLLQRVSRFEHIADGDTLCVTRDAYEDMAILCEWMAQRRHRPSPTGAGSAPSHAESPGSAVTWRDAAPSNAVPALRNMVEGDAARRNRSKTGIPPLWDSNGRSIRVADAAYRVLPTPGSRKGSSTL